MKIVVDSNILMSALITPKSKIAELLLSPFYQFQKATCYFLYIEILKHHDKILEITKLDKVSFLDAVYTLLKQIDFINEESVAQIYWQEAHELVKDVDIKDTPFVALSLQLDAYLWTGDKKLIQGLKNKGFQKAITTQELLILLSS